MEMSEEHRKKLSQYILGVGYSISKSKRNKKDKSIDQIMEELKNALIQCKKLKDHLNSL